MDIPATLPHATTVAIGRTQARQLLSLTADAKGGPTGARWERIDGLARDMADDRWLLGPDALYLLAHPGTIDGAVLVNGRDRLAAFLSTTRRKLEVVLLIADINTVDVLDALAVLDQQRGYQWHEYVAAQGVPNAVHVASISRTLHLLSVGDDSCLHSRRGGYSHAERWRFYLTLDTDVLDECRKVAVQTLQHNQIPMPQTAALLYLAQANGYGPQAFDFVTRTVSSGQRHDPAAQLARYCASMRTATFHVHELITWHAVVRAFHAHVKGETIPSNHLLVWEHGEPLEPLFPADLPAPRKAVAA